MERNMLDIVKIETEIAEIAKMMAETAKLAAETAKLNREARWYPVLISTALIGAGAALAKFFI